METGKESKHTHNQQGFLNLLWEPFTNFLAIVDDLASCRRCLRSTHIWGSQSSGLFTEDVAVIRADFSLSFPLSLKTKWGWTYMLSRNPLPDYYSGLILILAIQSITFYNVTTKCLYLGLYEDSFHNFYLNVLRSLEFDKVWQVALHSDEKVNKVYKNLFLQQNISHNEVSSNRKIFCFIHYFFGQQGSKRHVVSKDAYLVSWLKYLAS